MTGILPELTAFVVGALFSLVKETQEKKPKRYWVALGINSVLIFSSAEVARFVLETKHGKVPGIVTWCLFLSIGILSNMLSDLIMNTERWVEEKRVGLSDVVALIKTGKEGKDESSTDDK